MNVNVEKPIGFFSRLFGARPKGAIDWKNSTIQSTSRYFVTKEGPVETKLVEVKKIERYQGDKFLEMLRKNGQPGEFD